MAAQIVHDDHVTCLERREEELLDIIVEALAVDGLVEHAGGVDPVATQGCEEGHGSPMAIGRFGAQPLTLGTPTSQRGHVGFGPGFVDEDKTPGIKTALILLPLFAPARDLWPELFAW